MTDDPVAEQYETLPYPSRDPADEAKRLITGSPSHPVEIDHFLFGGKRDWRRPFRVLVAGGGTGDALVMLAQILATRGTPAEIHYLDMSAASRRIAEARIAARGLSSVTFHTGDLMRAADLGVFDYIDCCGVLHHLPDPEAGFAALAAAVAPDGGIGAMVYAPYGRSGVYEMQAALAALTDGLPIAEKLSLARPLVEAPPQTSGLARNPFIADHKSGDAGLFDLLLHARDAPFDVPRLLAALSGAGLRLAGWVEPARYDPALYLPTDALKERASKLDPDARAALAERLSGAMTKHRFYAAPAVRGDTVAAPAPDAVPVIHNIDAKALAASAAKTGRFAFNVSGMKITRPVSRDAARILARIDGRMTLDRIASASSIDWFSVERIARGLEESLGGFNHFRYSRLAIAGRPVR